MMKIAFSHINFQRSQDRPSFKKLLRSELGVGLIELMISTLIMAGIVGAILVAYSSLPANSNKDNALLVLQQDATLALEDIARSIRETTEASLVVQANQLTTTGGVYSVSSGLLQKSGNTLLGDYTYENYSMQVASLTFDDNSDDAIVLNTITVILVVNLTETRIDEGTGGAVTNTVDTLTFSTQAYPRNRTI